MIEHYVLIALSRFGNAVLDRNLYRKYGAKRILEALREKGFDCYIDIVDKTIIAKVVSK